MVHKKGMCWITSNPTEAHKTISKEHCCIEEVFQTQAKAEAWIDGEEQTPDLVPRYDSDSDNDSCLKYGQGRLKSKLQGESTQEEEAGPLGQQE